MWNTQHVNKYFYMQLSHVSLDCTSYISCFYAPHVDTPTYVPVNLPA